MGPLVSGSPCIPHYAVFLFSSLQIKSFQPLLLESFCTFILRVGSRTLSTWNSCLCHLCIIFGHARRDKPSPKVGVVPNWERLPRYVTIWHSDGVCSPGEVPHHSLATVDLSGLTFSLSLSL
jgi:hypothetical protein